MSFHRLHSMRYIVRFHYFVVFLPQNANQVEQLANRRKQLTKRDKQIAGHDRLIAARDAKIVSLKRRLAAQVRSAAIRIDRYRKRAERAQNARELAKDALAVESASKKNVESELARLSRKLKFRDSQFARLRMRHVNMRPVSSRRFLLLRTRPARRVGEEWVMGSSCSNEMIWGL